MPIRANSRQPDIAERLLAFLSAHGVEAEHVKERTLRKLVLEIDAALSEAYLTGEMDGHELALQVIQ